MNLHAIAGPIVGAVNSNQPGTLMQNTGFATNPDFSRTPTYTSTPVLAQLQDLSSSDVRLLNSVGIQGASRKTYLYGSSSGMIRCLQKGNDLLTTPDGSVWKVARVLEGYGHGIAGTTGWCSVALVLQNPTSDGAPPPLDC